MPRHKLPRRPRPDRLFWALEPLEIRTLLSVVVAANMKSTSYTDVDGDKVTITVSAGSLDSGDFTTAATGKGDQLQEINLSGGGFTGANLTVAVVKVPGGDGSANVGFLDAAGVDLGAVTINGDLGRISAGTTANNIGTLGVKSLSVRSIGRYGTDTQLSGNLNSVIAGGLGSLAVKTDVDQESISVTGTAGVIGSITIGGSLIGGPADNSGEISSIGNIGAVSIGDDITGGAGASSGTIAATSGSITSVTIGGSLVGGANENAGEIFGTSIGPVKIGGDLFGGSDDSAGSIDSPGNIASVAIAGSLIGGSSGEGAGLIHADGNLGAITIGGDLLGGIGTSSALVESTGGTVASVTIGGSIVGGMGTNSAEIFSNNNMGFVKIAGDVLGASGAASGSIESDAALGAVTVGGSILGGTGDNSGEISSTNSMGALILGGSLIGGAGSSSGSIESATAALAAVNIAGSVLGGAGPNTGEISSASAIGPVNIAHNLIGGAQTSAGSIFCSAGNIGTVNIGGSINGAAGEFSGSIIANGAVGALTLGGSLNGGSNTDAGLIDGATSLASVSITGSVTGGTAGSTGEIASSGPIGAVTIAHNLTGGSASGTLSLTQSGDIISSGGRIASVTIGGSIFSGVNNTTGTLSNCAAIQAGKDIGSITVKGSLVGNDFGSGGVSPVLFSAAGPATAGPKTDIAIGKITITGRVEFANIFAGYDISLDATNGSAQIGPVAVGGNWIASNLVAGAQNTTSSNTDFGDINDSIIDMTSGNLLSGITSVTIAGQILGTPNSLSPSDHFGFVATVIGSFKVAGSVVTLTAAPDSVAVGTTSDVSIHEISPT